jgi:hypothetical protein
MCLATSLTLSSRLHACVQVFSYSHEFDRVLGVWQSMEAARFAPTARLWGSLLLACSAAGQLEQAAIFWWEMKQLHSQGAGGVLTTDNVCAMMTACNDAGQVGAGPVPCVWACCPCCVSFWPASMRLLVCRRTAAHQ